LLAYGCPLQAIVHAYGLDERTVASWRDRAGAHCQRVHQEVVESASLDLVHVQADEIRVKGRNMVAWMGLAMMVSTRLWLAGVVSTSRNRDLADRLLQHVRACAGAACALLVSTDGWNAYPGSIVRAFRQKVKRAQGQGRAYLQVWPELCIATVIKRSEKKRIVEITRKIQRGTMEKAQQLLAASQGGSVLNTAFIERLNGTMRQRLAALTRRCRHTACRLQALESGMYLLGCSYNLCWPHHELSKATHKGSACTPAMASGLTDHVWSMKELLCHKVAPPAWVPLRCKGEPRQYFQPDPGPIPQPRLRLRKGALCSVTS
jgi:hypothetical protein